MTLASWSPHRGLDPSPDEARNWLEQELRGSGYRDPWLDSVLRWIGDHLSKLLDGVAQLSPLIAVLVGLVVIALLVWVLPKVRRESAIARSDAAVLGDLTMSARTYRDLAAQARRDGRYDDAILDGFRAIAKEMSDRTLLDDAPGRTAHEVSLALALPFPDQANRLARAADMFDSVRYGHRRASAEQAGEVERLDSELVRTRPVLAITQPQDLSV